MGKMAGEDLVQMFKEMKRSMSWVTGVSVQHAQAYAQETGQMHSQIRNEVIQAKLFLGKMEDLNHRADNLAIVHAQLKDMLRLIGYLEQAADRLLPAVSS